MFTHLVLLKRSPYYIYAANVEDAMKYYDTFKDDFLGVCVAEGGLEVKTPKIEIRLTPVEIMQIEEKKIPDPVSAEEVEIAVEAKEELAQELDKELNHPASSLPDQSQ